jgi:beta-glucosidase
MSEPSTRGPAWERPERSGEHRGDELLGQLDLDEKAALCHGRDLWTIDGCERLGIPSWTVSDGPIGIRGRGGTRTACFPSASAIAATFDLGLVRELGTAIGNEARAKNVQMALGPTVNLHRHPLTGRHFECYSEDPELSAQVAVAYIEGLQDTGVGACIKHYVANDQELERFTISADLDDRTLREVYLRPFEDAVATAGVWGVMGAYNFVNGVHACADPELLQGVLKEEWGFAGLVVSDWGALKDGVGPGRFGLDLEMPGPGSFFGGGRLADLVRSGEVPEAEVDDKARRILRFLDWCGALDDGTGATEGELDTPEQRSVARRVAVGSLVLLANDGILPLDPEALRSVAVLGPNAADTAALGGGSSTVAPYYTVSILEALEARLGDGVDVRHEPGCSIRRAVPTIDAELLGADRFRIEVLPAGGGEPVSVLTGQPPFGFLGADAWAGAARPVLLRGTATFIAPEAGVWRFSGGGLHRVRLAIDGGPPTDNMAPGAVNAGLGNHAGLVDRTLAEGQAVELAFEYEVSPGFDLALYNMGAALVGTDPEADADRMLAAAVEAARSTDVAIVVVGSNDEWESEGSDRADLTLPGEQDELVRQVVAANPRTIVVHNAGSPMAMPWVDDVAAIVQAWYPGQEGGNAVADVLVGDADAAGRMPTTWPKRLEDTPAFAWYPGQDGHVRYGEGRLIGYRWYDAQGIEPLWAFGHGLSYTSFAWGDATATAEQAVLTVVNTGDRAGVEVVQAYVAPAERGADDPPQVLAGFAKVELGPGESAAVEVALSPAAFRRWDAGGRGWVVDSGEREVRLGRSSADIVASVAITVGD